HRRAPREDEPARVPDAARRRIRHADGRPVCRGAREDAAPRTRRCDPAPARRVRHRRGPTRRGLPVTEARQAATALGPPGRSGLPRRPPRQILGPLLAPLPMQYARRHLVLPLGPADGPLTVAIADPLALAPLDDLRFLYERALRPLVVPAMALRDAIARAY